MDFLIGKTAGKPFVKQKFWILDYSFYIYNGTYAFTRKCKCVNDTTGKASDICSTCLGKGKLYLQNKDGFITGGLYYVFDQIIQRVQEGYKIILAFDPPKGDLYRTQLLDTYKGNRAPKPEYISAQMEFGMEIFPRFPGVLCFTSDICESDDVMASKALELANKGHDVVVASDDKDMYPLLQHKNITIYRQKAMFTKEDFIKKFGFEPGRFNEYLALVGDAADNFNFFKGLGDKAVTNIIQTFDHISHVYDRWDDVPAKYKKYLSDHDEKGKLIKHRREDMALSLKISTLHDTVECIPVKLEQDQEYVKARLEELELRQAANNLWRFWKEKK